MPLIPDVRWPDLIYVNGPSSAGKTTLSKGLQTAILEPYLCVGFDDFIFMSAPRYYLGADTAEQKATDNFTAQGAEMVRTSAPGDPMSVTLVVGPVFRRLLDTMPAAVRALIAGGNAVIFDDVLHDSQMFESRRNAFADLDVFAIGVVCDLDILEARECSRRDRVLGRARGLVDAVHSFCDYDVIVDTGAKNLDVCVAEVLETLTGRPPLRRTGLQRR